MDAASRRPIVFLGLSIDATEAAHILDADYRGPVMAGSLDALEPPADVLIIDGMLESGSRLDPGEAERALSRGIRLAGAASLGAVLAGRLEHRGLLIRAEKAEHGYDHQDKKGAQSLNSDAPLQPSPRTHRP